MSTEAPPPTYAPSQPQILVIPLPDSASFFWGRTVQGEVFVKGLGEGAASSVKSLSAQLHLTNHLPTQPTIPIFSSHEQVLYPRLAGSTSTPSGLPSDVFPSSHRFSFPLPPSVSIPLQSPSLQAFHSGQIAIEGSLPGSLDLSNAGKGEIRWEILVRLALSSGETITETVKAEGTPPDLNVDIINPVTGLEEVQETLTKDGVNVRLLIENSTPRLGDLLRLGVEVRPSIPEKATSANPSPDPRETLRPLRRVRVELFRRITVYNPDPQPVLDQPEPSSSTSPPVYADPLPSTTHLTLLHSSGKSMRYPGPNPVYPPLRVLFTLPSPHLGVGAEPTWGEISMETVYHVVTFFVRVTIGFGSSVDVGGGVDRSKNWTLERDITFRPTIWTEPRSVIVERGMIPDLGVGDNSGMEGVVTGESGMTDEQMAREAYRMKGMDVVGASGTFRYEDSTGISNEDLPPPFESEAGPSRPPGDSREGAVNGSGLPTFLESEAQMRLGEAPLPLEHVRSERLIPIAFHGDDGLVDPTEFDRTRDVGRRGSLGGELGTWVEYDGYETFSVQPPSMADSFGVGGSMDPPREGDEDDGVNIVGGMVARLGLGNPHTGGTRTGGLELMEELGLGEGTRVIDLQDDLPPGIDEPSLPALPDFRPSPQHPRGNFRLPSATIHSGGQSSPTGITENLPPPSFDASEAAEAVGGTARAGETTSSRQGSMSLAPTVGGHGEGGGEAPPGYFGQSSTTGHGALPPYS